MGFGSYDESEQETREVDADFDESGSVNTNSPGHDGAVEFEFTTSNDELLDRLTDIKDES
jgi:hypothetical protein